MQQILILCDDQRHLSSLQLGLNILRELKIAFSVRLCSAQKSPSAMQNLLLEFVGKEGKLLLCVAKNVGIQAGFAASYCSLPVLAVSFAEESEGTPITEGFPVACLGSGPSAFANACRHAAQILALQDKGLEKKLQIDRERIRAQLAEADVEQRIDFSPVGHHVPRLGD